MDEIDVFFTQKLYYSKKDIKNDFFITITNGKNLNPQPEKEKNKEDNNKKPTISILGLEKLFKKDSIDKLMDKFAEECPDVKIVLKRLVDDKLLNSISNGK